MRTLQARRGMILAFVTLALVAAACGRTANAHEGGGMTGTTTVTEGPANTFTFSPSTVMVTQGQTITLKNASNAPHTFTVTGTAIDVVTQPGKNDEVTIDLPPGTYPFVCRYHEAMGMKGTLVVR